MSIDIHLNTFTWGNLGAVVIKLEEGKTYNKLEIKCVALQGEAHPEYVRRLELLLTAIKEKFDKK